MRRLVFLIAIVTAFVGVGLWQRAPIGAMTVKLLTSVASERLDSEDPANAEWLAGLALAIAGLTSDPTSPTVVGAFAVRGSIYTATGQLAAAQATYEQALAPFSENTLLAGHASAEFALLLENFADLRLKLGVLADVEELYQHALVVRKLVHGSEHPAVANTLEKLGDFFGYYGRYAEATSYYRLSMEMRETAVGAKDPGLAVILDKLATVRRYIPERGGRRAILEQALHIREQAYGPDHEEVAKSLLQLARVYHERREYDEAKPLLERALIIQTKRFGESDRRLAPTLKALAGVHRALGQNEPAERFEQTAIKLEKFIQSSRDGPAESFKLEHFVDFETGGNGNLTKRQHRGGIASLSEYLEKGLQISIGSFGTSRGPSPIFPARANPLRLNIAGGSSSAEWINGFYVYAGWYFNDDAAVDLVFSPPAKKVSLDFATYDGKAHISAWTTGNRRILDYAAEGTRPFDIGRIRIAGRGFSVTSVLPILRLRIEPVRSGTNLVIDNIRYLSDSLHWSEQVPAWKEALDSGIGVLRMGDYLAAESDLLQAVALAEPFGPADWRLAISLNSLADAYRGLGNISEAGRLFKRALRTLEDAFGSESPFVFAALMNLARLNAGIENFEVAEGYYIQAVAIQEKQLGPDHLALDDSLGKLGEFYLRIERYADAEAMFRRSLRLIESWAGKDSPRTLPDRIARLAAVALKQRKIVEARVLLERNFKIFESTYGPDHPDTQKARLALRIVYQILGDQPAFERLLGYKKILETVSFLSPVNKRAVGVFDRQWMGIRFTLSKPTRIVRIGTEMRRIGRKPDDFFVAIVQLHGPSALPQGKCNGSDNRLEGVVVSNVFELPDKGELANTSAYTNDIRVPLAIDLPKGVYALIVGSGLFDTEGIASMISHTPVQSKSFTEISCLRGNGWRKAPVPHGLRFVIESSERG